jgi:hypothetical protein
MQLHSCRSHTAGAQPLAEPATVVTTTLVSLDAVGWPAEITTVLPARAVPVHPARPRPGTGGQRLHQAATSASEDR